MFLSSALQPTVLFSATNGFFSQSVHIQTPVCVQLPLTGALLFLLPHPLPQLLPDVQQRVLPGGQHLDGVAKPTALRLSTRQNKC